MLPLLILIGSAVLAPGVVSQTTVAKCASKFNWMSNDRGQSPCLVAAYLQQTCAPAQNWNVTALPQGQTYIGPSTTEATTCACSGIVYNLISACAACQNGFWVGWSNWSANCPASNTTVAQWKPELIPEGTAIQAWAYIDPSRLDTYNVAAAQSFADAAESTYIPSPSGTNTANLGTTASGANPSGTAYNGNSNSDGSDKNVGAIVGGVVGGVIALALIAAGMYYLKKHRRPTISPIQEYRPEKPGYLDMAGDSHSLSTLPVSSTAVGSQNMKLYNPEDPSTFPKTPMSMGTSMGNTSTSFLHPGSSGTPPSAGTALSGRYNGAAEV